MRIFIYMFIKYLPLFITLLLLSACERPTDNDSPDDGIPPSVPANAFIYSATDGVVIIEWNRNNEPGLKGYNIYRRTDLQDYAIIEFTFNDYYIDDSLDYNETYYYKISSVDNFERESGTTDELVANPINRFKPDRPLNIRINGRNWEGEPAVSLTWNPNTESDLAGYNIYRSKSASFISDSLTLIGFTNNPFYTDTASLEFYTKYYYKITAIDKGNLLSDPGNEIFDMILEIPEIIFPDDNYQSELFTNFLIKTVEIPTEYEIVVQTSQFYGEFWRKKVTSNLTYDTLAIQFIPRYIELNKKYYWRILTYSGNSSEPNSVSKLYSFILR